MANSGSSSVTFNHLPNDALKYIFSFLETGDVLTVIKVCKAWKEVLSENSLKLFWEKHLRIVISFKVKSLTVNLESNALDESFTEKYNSFLEDTLLCYNKKTYSPRLAFSHAAAMVYLTAAGRLQIPENTDLKNKIQEVKTKIDLCGELVGNFFSLKQRIGMEEEAKIEEYEESVLAVRNDRRNLIYQLLDLESKEDEEDYKRLQRIDISLTAIQTSSKNNPPQK